MNSRLLYLLLMLLAAVQSCSAPASSEQFVRNASRDAYGRYVFNADMTDSLASYNVSLISALSCIDRKFSGFSSMPVDILWESPDGQVFENSIVLGRNSMTDSSYYDKALIYSIGRKLVPERHGEWKIYVKVPEDTLRKYGITGMGVRIVKESF